MKRATLIAAVYAFLIAGCAIGFNHRGELVVIPSLPMTVELDADDYYYQDGYYYMMRGDVWYYSQSRNGNWRRLPRDHYPHEVHRHGDRDRGHDEGDHGDRHDR